MVPDTGVDMEERGGTHGRDLATRGRSEGPLERFAPPEPPPGGVVRRGVVARLRRDAGALVTVVRAPAGYGKTTALAQWAATVPGFVAWIDARPAHREPGALAADARAAREALGPGAHVLVVDHTERLTGAAAREALATVVAQLDDGWRLIVAGRVEPPLRLAAVRVARRLAEVGPADLAMDAAEAGALLAEAGVDATHDDTAALLARTEGWPAGLVLAGLALRDAPQGAAGVRGWAPAIADYLDEEVLPFAGRDGRALLMRACVLDELTPAACSAVSGTAVTLEDLRGLARRVGLVAPLDARADRFRMHPLLADLLRDRLRAGDPDAWPALHRRAADWADAQGDPIRAVRHLLAAGDDEAAAELAWRRTPTLLAGGRRGVLRRMLAAFPPGMVGERAPLALAMAWACTEQGSHLVAHWMRRAAAAAPPDAPGRDADLALLRALVGAGGAAAMADDARRARAGLPAGSPWRPFCDLLEGVASDVGGDAAGARTLLREACDEAGMELPAVTMLAHTWRAVMDARRGDRASCRLHAARAQEGMAHSGLAGYPSSALLHAVRSLEAAQRELPDRARAAAGRARLLMAGNAELMPWFAVMTRLVLARSAVLTGDREGARGLAHEAAAVLSGTPDLPLLAADAGSLAGALGTDGAPATGAGALTPAEMRVLGHLPTHLTFREIGERLHLSRFTVKSQALAVYRKLGVASRGEAVDRARALGLLAGDGAMADAS